MVIGVYNRHGEQTLILAKSICTFSSVLISEIRHKIKDWEHKTGNSLTKTEEDIVLECYRINRLEDRGITVIYVEELGYSRSYVSSIIFDFQSIGLAAPLEDHRIKRFKLYFLISKGIDFKTGV